MSHYCQLSKYLARQGSKKRGNTLKKGKSAESYSCMSLFTLPVNVTQSSHSPSPAEERNCEDAESPLCVGEKTDRVHVSLILPVLTLTGGELPSRPSVCGSGWGPPHAGSEGSQSGSSACSVLCTSSGRSFGLMFA
ncbi:unnamed protein product [Pleuronectes platessa]|uniref:Uncharacterized protein n=1 Tax=Pleuronectes platessa TaxID=8262 RepID=A0A9N7UW81_PLEPL|nr:unnamed protein product [Pleuronectes platessa]